MATANQTARDKFLEARKAGVDAVTARKQAYGEVAPAPTGGVVQAQPIAPVAGVAPAVTPTPTPAPTAPVTPAPTSVTGVDGQQFTQAPVDPNTGLSKPLEPTPVQTEQDINKQNGGFIQQNGINSVQPLSNTIAPVQPATPKTEPVVDYTQAKGREQDIINNLNTFKAQNMTPEQIMKASDYANATPEKKAIIDPYLKQQVPTATAMYNNIVAKADIPDEQKTSLPYKIAQNRYLKASAFSTMTPSQLSNEMTNSKLIQGSQAYEDLKAMNPKLVQDTENLRIVNGSKQNVFTYINNPDGTPVKVNNLENTFAQDYLDDYGTFLKSIYTPQTQEEVKNAIYTQDVRDAQDKATSIEEELNAIEKDINSIKKDVEGELAGTGAKGSRVRLEKIVRKEALQSEYESVLKSYTTYANKANNLINQNTAMYEKAYNQKQELIKAQTSAAGMKYANELALSQNQAEFEQKIAQQAQSMGTPELAIPDVINQYAQLGVMASVSPQEHIARAKQFIANGGTLGEYISQMQKDFQSKDAYKAKFSPKADTTPYQLANLGDGKAIMYNQSTGSYNVIGGSGQPVTTEQIPSIVEECRTTGSCGQGVNDYLQKLGDSRVFGNAYSEKQSKINSQEPVVGGIAVWQPTGKMAQPEYGHVGIVTAVNGDQVTITDWNWKGDNKQSTHVVPLSSIQANGGGFYVPKTQGTGTQGTTPVSSEANSWVNAWNNGTMDIETILTKIGSTKEALPLKNEVIRAIDAQGGVAWRKENDPMVTKVDDLINKLDTASKSKYINTIAGNIQTSLTNFMTGGKNDLLADLKSVIEGGTLQALIDAKAQGATFGALSNEELKMLQATSSALAGNAIRDKDTNEIIGFKMSEEKLKSEIDKMRNLLSEKKNRMTGVGIRQESQAQPVIAPQQSNTGAGVTYSYGGQNVTLNGGY